MAQNNCEYESMDGVQAMYLNTFYDRYWRNKRYNVQCFPRDGVHGDYCNWLMAPKDTKGDLSVPLPVRIQVQRSNDNCHAYDQVSVSFHMVV